MDAAELPPNLGAITRVTDWPRAQRYSLGAVARCLEACATQNGENAPDFLVLNANHHVFQQFVGQFLIATDTPFPTHVRKGRPRTGVSRLYRASAWKYNEDLMRSFFAYEEQDHSLVTVGPGHTIDFTSEGRAARYKDGHWGSMDYSGTWFDGYKAAILFAPAPSYQDDLVLFLRINEAFLGPEKEPMRLKVFFEGEFLTRWTIFTQFQISTCKVVLPARLLAGKKSCRLELHAENPQSAERVALSAGLRLANEDPRELSVKVQQATFTSADLLRYSISDTLDFTDRGNGAPHLNECWSQPDSFGVWTLGPEANLVLILKGPVTEPLAVIVTMNDVAVNAENPALNVRVDINGATVAHWTLGPTRVTDERSILLPKGFPTSDPILISFHIEYPRTPVQLNWSTWDLRPLGFRLNKFRIVPAGSLKYRLGGVIDLTDTGNSPAYVGDYLATQWALPDPYGSWTVGQLATIKISFDQAPTTGFPASFVISDCVLSKTFPSLPVRIKANGRQVTEWTLGPERDPHCRTINVPAESVAGQPELILTFEIPTPRSPESLGWNSDTRPLGFRLARAVLGSATIEIPAFGERAAPKRTLTTRIIGLPRFALHVARLMAGRALRWWDER